MVSIDSIPNTESPLKARIVISNNGKLKIQCLKCMATRGNIVTHAKNTKCKIAFNKQSIVQLQELMDRLHCYQRRNWNKRYWDKYNYISIK